MRECPDCGASNGATDDFCGNCGGYLGWSDAAATAARTGPEPEPAPGGPECSTRPDAAPDAAPDATSGTTDSSTNAATGAATAATTPSTAPTGHRSRRDTSVRASGGTDSAPLPPSASAGSPAPPASLPTPREAAPQPVKPAKATAPRPVVRPTTAEDLATGVPCPQCRTPNPPERRFCRRCAEPLAPTAVTTPLPWWRTVWPLRRRARTGSGRLVRLAVIIAVVVALCAGGFLLLPAGKRLFEDTRDKLGQAKAVSPTGITATAQLPGHPADNTTDGLRNRYWAVPRSGASVTYTFSKPFRFVDLILTNGASKDAEEYALQARALRMEMEVMAQDGQMHRKTINLSDKPGPQTIPVGISDAKSIRLTLGSPAGLTRDRHIALAEVEFFQRT